MTVLLCLLWGGHVPIRHASDFASNEQFQAWRLDGEDVEIRCWSPD